MFTTLVKVFTCHNICYVMLNTVLKCYFVVILADKCSRTKAKGDGVMSQIKEIAAYWGTHAQGYSERCKIDLIEDTKFDWLDKILNMLLQSSN